ncbi:MAG: hypothetical protein KJO80_01380 [Gammaproteobacteria bacterium]|nr:hypothetical protein [Gammaproteobacteria bacterium]
MSEGSERLAVFDTLVAAAGDRTEKSQDSHILKKAKKVNEKSQKKKVKTATLNPRPTTLKRFCHGANAANLLSWPHA